jgi:hypothetical protein
MFKNTHKMINDLMLKIDPIREMEQYEELEDKRFKEKLEDLSLEVETLAYKLATNLDKDKLRALKRGLNKAIKQGENQAWDEID